MSLSDLSVRAFPTDIPDDALYGYVPSKPISILFLALFALSSLIHIGQAGLYRSLWLIPTAVLCGILEVVGWNARLWSSVSPTLGDPFKIQITCTIIAPTPLLAANFVILGRIVRRLGPEYSRISPRLYTIVFCISDLVSLVIQAIGGAKAASAAGVDEEETELGGRIMLGGIVFQLFMIMLSFVAGAEYFIRYRLDKPIRHSEEWNAKYNMNGRGVLTGRLKIMLAALVFGMVCLLIRSVYRMAELAEGWGGRIIETEVYFNVLDGAMIVLAMFVLNFVHPGVFLTPPGEKSASWGSEDQKWSQDMSMRTEWR